MKPRHYLRFQLFTVAMLSFAGCAPATGALSGKVLYKGKPLPDGNVFVYHPDGRRFARGAIQGDGTYSIPDAPVGDLKVTVDSPTPIPPIPPGTRLPGGSRAAVDPNFQEKLSKYLSHPKIPQRYGNSGTSGLSVTVKRGSQEYNIELTD